MTSAIMIRNLSRTNVVRPIAFQTARKLAAAFKRQAKARLRRRVFMIRMVFDYREPGAAANDNAR